jgi:MoxR-like ATPase
MRIVQTLPVADRETVAGLVDTYRQACAWANTLILGKPHQVKLAFSCFLAGGHLLLDDLPGVGKTTLARTLAHALSLDFKRIQFTADLLPSDIVGVSIYESASQKFQFHKGPVFTHLLLADEINRASPRTQSALLEAMEEHQVSIDNETHNLPNPFFVVATQNPVDMAGTFPLPDSQLDRFLFRVAMGYPNAESEIRLLLQNGVDERLHPAPPAPVNGWTPENLSLLRDEVSKVHVEDRLARYVRNLLEQSRTHSGVTVGLSPRAGLALIRGARAWAMLDSRNHVRPEDVQAVFPAVASHRLVTQTDTDKDERDRLVSAILQSVPVEH